MASAIKGPDYSYIGWLANKQGYIDHILVKNSAAITVQNYTIAQPSAMLSDHYPVIVDWDWK